MMEFIKNPNLPDGKVASLICGRIHLALIDYFRSRGIELLFTEDNKCADKAVSGHCDLSAFYLGEGRIIVYKGQAALISVLKEKGFTVIETVREVGGRYPDDCILNHAIIGKYIIGKRDIFDQAVKDNCGELDVISVNQGYCKCSVLVVDEDSIITDDVSIAQEAAKNRIESLLISKGDVFLDGHSYGFIGGASGKISKNEVVFFGDITKHRDYKKIKKYLQVKGIDIISFDFPLTDFGGIIPIEENIF